MSQARISILFDRCINRSATERERGEFLQMAALPEHELFVSRLIEARFAAAGEQDGPDEDTSHSILSAIFAADEKDVALVRPMRRLWWAAAVVVLLIATGAYLWTRSSMLPTTQTAQVNDAAPGTSKATLTLSDGTVMTLDSAGNRVLRQGGSSIRQQGGQLIYDAAAETKSLSYNILTTPRGGQFRITLPDGTRAWLNAASSIRYPAAFAGKERAVAVTGEAYFEVVKDAERPFRVRVGGKTTIEVLGTSFNINAYTDEPATTTTLIEGSVLVKAGNRAVKLEPGQGARVMNNMEISIAPHVNLAAATAWKNGLFNFYGKDLPTVMKQLSRWYDVDIVYAGNVPQRKFWGEIQRSLRLSEVLEVLKESNVHFKIEGRTLTVMP